MKLYRYQGTEKPVQIQPRLLPSMTKEQKQTLEEAKPTKFESAEDEQEAHRTFAVSQLERSHPHVHKKYHNYD